MMIMEDFKKERNNSLKEIQENTGKQLEALKGETQKFFKELQENTTKQVKELNKTTQDLKMEVETIKKSQGLQKRHSFWDRQKRHSFWDRPPFQDRDTWHLPRQRRSGCLGGL